MLQLEVNDSDSLQLMFLREMDIAHQHHDILQGEVLLMVSFYFSLS
jgi:hypothetical protein